VICSICKGRGHYLSGREFVFCPCGSGGSAFQAFAKAVKAKLAGSSRFPSPAARELGNTNQRAEKKDNEKWQSKML
jgi:hypothetical protein